MNLKKQKQTDLMKYIKPESKVIKVELETFILAGSDELDKNDGPGLGDWNAPFRPYFYDEDEDDE